MSVTPFVVGNWVKGRRFYGRATLIDEILNGNRSWLWLLGTRRIGKTSLLRQIEHIAATTPESKTFPLFWDLQASSNTAKLHESFAEYLEDAEDRLEDHGIQLDDVMDEKDLFSSMKRLRRKLRPKGMRLLILCDEVEKLIEIDEKDPDLLPRLREMMQRYEDIRTVMASTIQLWALAEKRGNTSPFLHGFSPLYIHNLTDDEARSLIRQANLPNESRPRIDDETVEAIRTRCDNHPYLVQLLCKRYVELGNLDEAVEQVGADPMVSFFFSVDFEMLSDHERAILRIISEHDSSTSNSIQATLPSESSRLANSLHRLEHLGYIRRDSQRRFVLINHFFKRWFRDLEDLQETRVSANPVPTTRGSISTQTTLTADVELGKFDGRYELLERVGFGATGVVYKAEDLMLRSTIAVKLLKPEYASNDEALERLRREIILSRDISHSNVVKIFHLGQFQAWKYLTMQWVGGPTLAQVIKEEAPLSIAKLVRLSRILASALGAAHGVRILHRDVKPHNILIHEDGSPHLTDFGLARLMDDPGLTRSGVYLGTPDYSSPEQATLAGADERSDLYALGVIIYEMTTGRLPFKAETAREVLEMHASSPLPDPKELRPDLPPALRSLIRRCLEKEPARRFQTAGELEQALARVV